MESQPLVLDYSRPDTKHPAKPRRLLGGIAVAIALAATCYLVRRSLESAWDIEHPGRYLYSATYGRIWLNGGWTYLLFILVAGIIARKARSGLGPCCACLAISFVTWIGAVLYAGVW